MVTAAKLNQRFLQILQNTNDDWDVAIRQWMQGKLVWSIPIINSNEIDNRLDVLFNRHVRYSKDDINNILRLSMYKCMVHELRGQTTLSEFYLDHIYATSKYRQLEQKLPRDVLQHIFYSELNSHTTLLKEFETIDLTIANISEFYAKYYNITSRSSYFMKVLNLYFNCALNVVVVKKYERIQPIDWVGMDYLIMIKQCIFKTWGRYYMANNIIQMLGPSSLVKWRHPYQQLFALQNAYREKVLDSQLSKRQRKNRLFSILKKITSLQETIANECKSNRFRVR